MSLPIPDFQPIPFPAPLGLLKAMLVVGFYLHALPMNVTLVGGVVSALFIMYGNLKNHHYAKRLGGALAFSLPFFVSVAITQGIVPLLFLQLIYGPLFYTSSILIAAPWIMVIFLLLAAYYAYYLHTYRHEVLGSLAPWILIGAGVLFMIIAFFFSNNTTLMLAPQKWAAIYQANPSGLNLNLGEAQLIPRYIHFIVGAVAVTGLTIGCFGLYWHSRDRDYGSWLIRKGAALFLLMTLLQILVGAWFLLSLDSFAVKNFMGGDPTGTAVFASSMLLDLIGLIAMTLAWRRANSTAFKVGLVSALLVIFLMVVMRHLVRVYYTQSFFSPEQFPVDTQWIPLILFLVSTVIGIAYIAWLIKITWGAFHPSSLQQEEKS